MSIKHSLLAAAYHPLRWYNSIRRSSSPRLRALIYHDVSPAEIPLIRRQLQFMSRRWKFVDALTFGRMVNGELPLKEDSLLLTFDDGFISCRHVADQVLQDLNIKALFFVVSDFIAITDDSWREFVATHINLHMLSEQVPEHCRNMAASDLQHLAAAGHTVGGHTATHARLSGVPVANLATEIVASADALETMVNQSVDHFAYTFGNLQSFSADALRVARQRFSHIYTGLRGDNAVNRLPWALCRDSIKPADSLLLAGSFLEGGADKLYTQDLATYQAWGREGPSAV